MPRTGGGATVMMKASWIAASLGLQSPADRRRRQAGSPGALLERLQRREDRAGIGALVKVAAAKPAKGTACATPGVASMMSTARRTTSSVRASEAPGGSWITRDQVALVQVGDEALGRACRTRTPVRPISPA